MANALAQRRRLGAALMDLRIQRGLTHAALAAASGVSAAVIARTENPIAYIERKPNLLSVRKLLDALAVQRGSEQWTAIEGYAEAGTVRGWWEDTPIGDRQKSFARVEDGASEVEEYAVLLLPGTVQHPAYARHRVLVGSEQLPADVEAVVGGRLRRQQMLASGTLYRLVLEEQTIRRAPVPLDAMAQQLDYLLDLMARPNVSVRVIPVDARLGDGAFPRSPFARMLYPDPGDPQIVTVDTVTEDLLVTGAAEVAGYAQLHQRLRDASLSDEDSVAFIQHEAARLAVQV